MLNHYTTCSGKKATPQAAFSSQAVDCRYNPCEAGRHDEIVPDCALRNHYTMCAGKKATPQAAFSSQAVDCRYNPCEAGRHDEIVPDCALRNHYTSSAVVNPEDCLTYHTAGNSLSRISGGLTAVIIRHGMNDYRFPGKLIRQEAFRIEGQPGLSSG